MLQICKQPQHQICIRIWLHNSVWAAPYSQPTINSNRWATKTPCWYRPRRTHWCRLPWSHRRSKLVRLELKSMLVSFIIIQNDQKSYVFETFFIIIHSSVCFPHQKKKTGQTPYGHQQPWYQPPPQNNGYYSNSAAGQGAFFGTPGANYGIFGAPQAQPPSNASISQVEHRYLPSHWSTQTLKFKLKIQTTLPNRTKQTNKKEKKNNKLTVKLHSNSQIATGCQLQFLGGEQAIPRTTKHWLFTTTIWITWVFYFEWTRRFLFWL